MGAYCRKVKRKRDGYKGKNTLGSVIKVLLVFCGVTVLGILSTGDVEGELMEEPLPWVFPSGYSPEPEKNWRRVKEKREVIGGEIRSL